MRSRSLWNKNMEPGLGPFREWNGMGWWSVVFDISLGYLSYLKVH